MKITSVTFRINDQDVELTADDMRSLQDLINRVLEADGRVLGIHISTTWDNTFTVGTTKIADKFVAI